MVWRQPWGCLQSGSTPTPTCPTVPDANQPEAWEAYFDVAGIDCEKFEPVKTPYIVPEADEGRIWYAAIIKAGSEEANESEDANDVDMSVAAGDELTHSTDKEISHVILCSVPEVTMTPTPSVTETETPTPTPTPSVTETETPTPTPTPSVTETETPTPSPTETVTVAPSASEKPTSTVKPTATYRPSTPAGLPKTGN